MKFMYGYIAIFAVMFTTLTPLSVHAEFILEPPHLEVPGFDEYDCNHCHNLTENPLLECIICHKPTRKAPFDLTNRCLNCHGPEPSIYPAILAGTHSSGTSGTERFSYYVECVHCHDPHRHLQDQLYGTTYGKFVEIIISADLEVTDFTVEPPLEFEKHASAIIRFTDETEFDDGDDYYTEDICNTCHTQTNHHQRDGSAPGGQGHFDGTDCTSCHLHVNGFGAPAGGGACTACHAQEQGERRQIVGAGGDFGKMSHHVRGEVQDEDCMTCHYVVDHASQTVKLKDADQGDAQVYSYDPTDPAGLEAFCLSCHDEDGAADGEGLQPFSDGYEVPDIEGGVGSTWEDSAHRQIGFLPNGGSPLTCLGDGTTTGCHGDGHGSDNEKILSSEAGVGDIDEFCFNCHTEGGVMNPALSGGDLSDDIEQAFGLSVKHDLGTSFTIAGNTYELQCTTCHNPHVATGPYWESDQGMSSVTRPDLTTDPSINPRAMGTLLWGAAAGEKMNDYVGTGKYQTPGGSTHIFDGSQLPDYVTFCLDCHSNDIGSIKGKNWDADPHGKKRAGYSGLGIDYSTAWGPYQCPNGYNICGRAAGWGDEVDPALETYAWPVTPKGAGYVGFVRGAYSAAERNAGLNFTLCCTDCHEAHGSDKYSLMRKSLNAKFDGTELILSSNQADWHGLWQGGDPEGLCWSCHGGYQLTKEHFQWHHQTGYCSACHSDHHPDHIGMGAFECLGVCHSSDYAYGGGWGWYNPATFHENRKALSSSTAYDTADYSPELVLDMRFEGNLKDEHMWNLHGLFIVGSGSFVSGKVGTAIEINDNPVEIGAENAIWDSTNEGYTGNTSKITEMKYHMTLETWVYPTSDPSDGFDRYIITKHNYWSGGYSLKLKPTGGEYRAALITNMAYGGPTDEWDGEICNGLRGAYSSVAIPLNQWTHVATTFDTDKPDGDPGDLSVGRIRIYVNGEDVTTSNSAGEGECWAQPQAGEYWMTSMGEINQMYPGRCDWCGTALSVGGINWSEPNENFIGRLDEVMIWNSTKDASYFDGRVAPVLMKAFYAGDSIIVAFNEGVYGTGPGGALHALDFTIADCGGREIVSVEHTPGEATATLTLDSEMDLTDVGVCTVAAAASTITDGLGSAYAEAIPVVISLSDECPTGEIGVELDEDVASPYVFDEQYKLVGRVNNPVISLPGDGYFHGDENEATYIDLDNNDTCMKEANALTIEARVKPSVVDLDFFDGDGDGIDDDDDPDEIGLRNSTQQRVFERKKAIQFIIFRGNWVGDGVVERAGKARVNVKYFVDSASRHDCPHPHWPDDPYEGADSRWHELSSDMEQYPIVAEHWYRIRVVFNSDKSGIPGSSGIPVDIFADDQGTDGLDTDQLWDGFINIAMLDVPTCKFGGLPGDFIALEDGYSCIGDNLNHSDIPGDTNNTLFKGLIDWVTWKPVADYSGVDDSPH